jgi:hypothetical protein
VIHGARVRDMARDPAARPDLPPLARLSEFQARSRPEAGLEVFVDPTRHQPRVRAGQYRMGDRAAVPIATEDANGVVVCFRNTLTRLRKAHFRGAITATPPRAPGAPHRSPGSSPSPTSWTGRSGTARPPRFDTMPSKAHAAAMARLNRTLQRCANRPTGWAWIQPKPLLVAGIRQLAELLCLLTPRRIVLRTARRIFCQLNGRVQWQ